jgi:glycosyltransferase involved in cell wall biosynthesis
MHVLVVNNLYPPIMAGGAERIVAYLCEGLVQRGHRVTVVSTCGPDMEPYPVEFQNGVEVIRYFPPNVYWSYTRKREPGFKKLMWHARDAWNARAGARFAEILREKQPDVVHTHLIDGFSASIWAEAKAAGIGVIHTAHDYHLICPRAFMLTREWNLCTKPQVGCKVYKQWHLRTTRHVDIFSSPSRFLLERHQAAGLRAGISTVVHNGIPQPTDSETLRRARPPESRKRFVMLTRLTPEKGIDVVLDAIARLPKDLDFEVAIGGRGPLEDRVKIAAALDHRIVPLGFVDGAAKTEALTRAGYLLLPSLWYENAPVTIIEAAAYGLGLIGSNIGAIPEFVEDGETGLLFAPGDADALANVMLRVIQDQNPLPNLALKSRALAERFTLDGMIENYERHYTALLRQPVAKPQTVHAAA